MSADQLRIYAYHGGALANDVAHEDAGQSASASRRVSLTNTREERAARNARGVEPLAEKDNWTILRMLGASRYGVGLEAPVIRIALASPQAD
jgi:hypothetical protein